MTHFPDTEAENVPIFLESWIFVQTYYAIKSEVRNHVYFYYSLPSAGT